MKKLLSLFMLLVAIVTGAKAADVTATWGNVSSNKMSATLAPTNAEAVVSNAVLVTSPVSFSFNGTASVSGDSNSGLSGNVSATKIAIPKNTDLSADAEMVNFTLKPNDGYTFTPSSIVFYAAVNSFGNKSASDNQYISYAVYSGTTGVVAKTTPQIGRSDSGTGLTKIIINTNLGSNYDSTDGLTLKLYLNSGYSQTNAKNIVIYGVSFAGAINTASSETYTVSFNAGSHGTYTGGDITETSAGAGITLPSLTSIAEGYAFNGWYTAATEGTKVGDAGDNYKPSADTPLYAQYSELSAPTKPSITGVPEAAVAKNASVTLIASSTGTPNPTYQWYTCDSEGGNQAEITGADEASYSPATTSLGTTYYIVKASNSVQSGVASDVVAIQVVGSSECKLTNIKFSNGAYGAISNTGADDIQVPYMAGTEAPTVEEASINISDGATYVLSGNTLTVTAEDGTTSKEYTINAVEITPLNVTADVTENFTAVPSWVFNLYGYEAAKGVKFAKKVDEASNMRIAKGNTRQYYFIGAAKSLTLTAIEQVGDKGAVRKVNVYVNGTKVISDTNNNALGAIALDETAPCMVMIESNQTNGDGGFSAYAIEAAATETITPAAGKTYTTYSCTKALDFSDVEGLEAYAAVSAASGKVVMTKVTDIPANTGLVLKKTGTATSYNVPVGTATSLGVDNKLVAATTATAVEAYNGTTVFNYILKNGEFHPATAGTLAAGKAYLHLDASAGQQGLVMEFDDTPTAVEAVAEAKVNVNVPVKVIKNGQLFIGNYTVAGARVK